MSLNNVFCYLAVTWKHNWYTDKISLLVVNVKEGCNLSAKLLKLYFFSLLQTMRYSTSLLASATGGQTREWENMCLLPGREGLSMHPYVFAEENQNAYPYSLITAM